MAGWMAALTKSPCPWPPPCLWRNHRLHHCKNEHYWFGVTMLSGDRLLGTAPAVADVALYLIHI